MAEEKKNEAKKIIDVAHPGKTPPSGNSKSVIVGHGPMMKDPMVIGTDPDKIEPPSEDLSKRTSKSVIKPTGTEDEEEPKKEKPKNKQDSKSKSKSKHKLESDDDKKTIAALAAEVDAEDVEDSDNEDNSEKSGVKTLPPADLPIIDVDEDEAKTEAKDDSDDGKEGEAKDEKSDSEAENSEKDEKSKNEETNPNEAELKNDEEEKHQKEIQKLADSKQFYLPINAVEKRRSKRVVLFGVLLSVLLLGLWVNIMLDAGLMTIKGAPHTSFFDQKTIVVVTTAQAPATKTFTTTNSKLSFRYPSSWKVVDSSKANEDSVFVNDNDESKLDQSSLPIIPEFQSPATISSESANTSTILTVSYKELKNKINDQPVYLRDLIAKSDKSGYVYISSSLTNNNLEKAGTKISNLYTNFSSAPNVNSKFIVAVIKSFKDTEDKATINNLNDARAAFNRQPLKQARTMLLSTAPATTSTTAN